MKWADLPPEARRRVSALEDAFLSHKRLLGDVLAEAYALGACEAEKGPRPYHTGHVLYGKKALDKSFARLHSGEEPEWEAQRRADAELESEVTQESSLPAPDHKACPHAHEEHRFDDDGGPPRRDWDQFPKVGMDIMAITRAISKGA